MECERALRSVPISIAKLQIERLHKWVPGDYPIPVGQGKAEIKIDVQASIGVVQWRPGETSQEVIARADAAMYQEKKLSR